MNRPKPTYFRDSLDLRDKVQVKVRRKRLKLSDQQFAGVFRKSGNSISAIAKEAARVLQQAPLNYQQLPLLLLSSTARSKATARRANGAGLRGLPFEGVDLMCECGQRSTNPERACAAVSPLFASAYSGCRLTIVIAGALISPSPTAGGAR